MARQTRQEAREATLALKAARKAKRLRVASDTLAGIKELIREAQGVTR